MKAPGAFKIGQTVEWESQSNGVISHKQGLVVLDANEAARLLPNNALTSRNPVRTAQALFPNHRLMFDGIIWPAGRVIVEVKSEKGKPALYMPRLIHLRVKQ